jgi:hypothetical protein
MQRERLNLWMILLALALVSACSDDGGSDNSTLADLNGDDTTADGTSADGGGTDDTAADGSTSGTGTDTATAFDLGPLPDVPDPTADRGQPCTSNAQCLSGFCLSVGGQFVCSSACADDSECAPIDNTATRCAAAGAQRVCVEAGGTICDPCLVDDNCPAGLCVLIGRSRVCGSDCDSNADCPTGTTCVDSLPSTGALARKQCVPSNQTCDCTAENAGQSRACVRYQEDSRFACFGSETCDPSVGWFGCDAPQPQPEVCDGLDNDCNNLTDDGLPQDTCEATADGFPNACQGRLVCQGEAGWVCDATPPTDEVCDFFDNDCDGDPDQPFKDADGNYATEEHCGTCNSSCADRFPLAATTRCEVREGAPVCVIDSCIDGFGLQGENICAPLASSLCALCQTDADCNQPVGDSCLDYGNGVRFCGRDCSASSPFGESCPSGYACDGATSQCKLETGNCVCGQGDSFIRPCSQPNPTLPGVLCVGSQTCNNGALSACEFPIDTCDGFDNDCDGEIDQDFRDGAGLYDLDAHCGACNFSCATLFSGPSLNGQGQCDTSSGAAQCVLVCDSGYFDVDSTASNGCECQFTSATDLPDDAGVDANCDGIDGQVSRGVFVSPAGSDTNPGTLAQPVKTVQRGIQIAAASSGVFDHVYVAGGVYQESVTLTGGVSLYGGYSANFRVHNPAGNETAIFGAASTTPAPGAVNARALTSAVLVDGFTIVGHDGVTPGASSYAVYLQDTGSLLTLRRNRIVAGNGAAGSRGTDGAAGSSPTQSGGVGLEPVNALVASGSATAFACVNGTTLPGGGTAATNGGAGAVVACPVAGAAGAAGSPGVGSGATPGAGGSGANSYSTSVAGGICDCSGSGSNFVGGNGAQGGQGTGGSAGARCSVSRGRVVNGLWVAGTTDAQPGGLGGPGAGGGGGGVGAGVKNTNGASNCVYQTPTNPQGPPPITGFRDMLGGAGGGGGAGGCGGNAGLAGVSGGGSFAVFAYWTTPTGGHPQMTANTIIRGRGGDGGDGGAGGEGGNGSSGGDTGRLPFSTPLTGEACAEPGGRGGDGGSGGSGGGGGGGCGGSSMGVFFNNAPASPPNYSGTNTFPSSGNAGAGGRGGFSRGNSGIDGQTGQNVEVQL